jgi:hypothetical protein
VQRQFDNWFGKAFEATDPTLAKEVLKVFHVDSWECGSQNWSPHFADAFKKQHGYDITPWLLTLTGVPIESAEHSEKVLRDVREAIAQQVHDVFYTTLKKSAHALGCRFSAEAIAPTMVSDGMLHYKQVDLPMGEFWINSPTHDKPNDMLDAISGAHVYGKRIIQAEAFTSVRMNWAEHPGNLKIPGDRNFALGVNKMVLHVFTHNPWIDTMPGMTLDGVGLYYQRNQTWFKQSKAWIEYLTRCQALLQQGMPVTDIAVFTGDQVPRRAVLPDRLVSTLPGLFGDHSVQKEKVRLANAAQPLRQIPDGVTHSANMADPKDWIDPLNGYAYDSFNPDALLLMQVKNGNVVMPGGAIYKVLVIPGKTKMNPAGYLGPASLKKLHRLAAAGARMIMPEPYYAEFKKYANVKPAPYTSSSLASWGLDKDVEVKNVQNAIAWTHRQFQSHDIYFLSNQTNQQLQVELSFRTTNTNLEKFDPVTGIWNLNEQFKVMGNRIHLTQTFEPGQSLFFIFSKQSPTAKNIGTLPAKPLRASGSITGPWQLNFHAKYGGPTKPLYMGDSLKSWTNYSDPAIRYYSGSAVYRTTFNWTETTASAIYLQLQEVHDIATVKVNGMDCGTLWTSPYRVDILQALKTGENTLEIEVTNTWHNRLIGDNLLPPEKRVTWTTAPFRLKDKPLLPAGITGNVQIWLQ